MANDMTSEQMQARITAARREAEGLKDRIKRKKDDLADTNRTYSSMGCPFQAVRGFLCSLGALLVLVYVEIELMVSIKSGKLPIPIPNSFLG